VTTTSSAAEPAESASTEPKPQSGPAAEAAAADWLALNRANWNARVPIHAVSRFYDLPGFVAGREELRGFELEEVGDVAGRTLLHLQCHLGTDTLAWARHGAVVTGLDFSGQALETARSLAGQIGVQDADFVESDVYSASEALGARTFDIVYTGLGALPWLPDLERWARVAASLVKPGGFFYLAEFHPFADTLAMDARTVEYDYFADAPEVWDEGETYTDSTEPLAATVSVQFQHGLGSVVSALTTAGLRLEFLHEHDYTLFPRFTDLMAENGRYRLPAGRPRVPLIYSLRASKPVVG
jgi:SAM-dependent methyltransferase